MSLTRRIPAVVRDRLISRYNRNNLYLPSTSFLHSASDRLTNRPCRPGYHYVEINLSRRNQRKVDYRAERRLWNFVLANLSDRVPNIRQPNVSGMEIIEILPRGRAGVKLNAQPVRVQGWFKYDNDDNQYAGRLTRMFAVSFSSRSGYEVILYMERWLGTLRVDDTDYDLDTNAAVKVEVVPLKSLAALLLAVPHWNPDLQSRTRLLFMKEL